MNMGIIMKNLGVGQAEEKMIENKYKYPRNI